MAEVSRLPANRRLSEESKKPLSKNAELSIVIHAFSSGSQHKLSTYWRFAAPHEWTDFDVTGLHEVLYHFNGNLPPVLLTIILMEIYHSSILMDIYHKRSF